MNESKSSQLEGYDFYDQAEIAFNAAGGAEVFYIAGTNARVALPGLGALDNAIWPISETYPVVAPFFPGLACPHDAQITRLSATAPCLVRYVSRSLVGRWVAAFFAGAPFSPWPILPVQEIIPANTTFMIQDKWAILSVIGSGIGGGTLFAKASG